MYHELNEYNDQEHNKKNIIFIDYCKNIAINKFEKKMNEINVLNEINDLNKTKKNKSVNQGILKIQQKIQEVYDYELEMIEKFIELKYRTPIYDHMYKNLVEYFITS